ncbi:LTA synthase family protein [Halomonas urumqiensis]|uniref:Capsular biosynthesis protein n=1 Tax=Halomonas urumqiensis TaxID=1684789 RepID=A0A2N7UCI7_9GAMM|nr:LTA synthase family protein [Halomonas urumqiensis]PMR78158.1 capsular biosynthesis protein [Halomonas urumqiensis]PTB03307.1 capsular biosynthesis protein [Halomonas urumqiensis]GHE20530.1 capsular polysaccharide biosynthesis protein [Halomonas urumqiensis]
MLGAWLPPLLVGLAVTLIIEALLRPPVPAPWRRPPSTLAVHLGSWLALFALCLLVLQRPWFALVLIASLQLVVVQSSNTKSTTLREPFICQDFEYFLDAILHPRLYVPFFGIALAIAASTAGALAIAAFLWFEPSLSTRHGATAFLATCAMLSVAAVPLLWWGLRHLPKCTLNPQQDLERLGLASALWAYGRLALTPLDTEQLDSPFAAPKARPDAEQAHLPHVVAVQSESFFDPRPWHPGVPGDLLPAFDALKRDALAQGSLQVPAWGANTVRTECAFLTGLDEQALGIHRFNPYRQLARRPVPNLVARFKALGYHTVCVHPYPASFYLRDRVMPRLGFDEFIDSAHFSDNQRDGQYIADLAVANKVGTLLKDSDNEPLFVFVITMENHGPLHLERPIPPDAPTLEALEGTAQPGQHAATDDLRVYLRHLRNADGMLDLLRTALVPSTPHSRHGVLCWYGDHVPIMPALYQQVGEPSGETSYAIWSSRTSAIPQTRIHAEPIDVSMLGVALLERVMEMGDQRDAIDRHGASDRHDECDQGVCDPQDAVGQTQNHQEQE